MASAVEDIFLTELEWAADGQTVLATHVDRTGEEEVLSIAEVAVDTGTITPLVADGITPAVVGDDLSFDGWRRLVRRRWACLTPRNDVSWFDGEGVYDLSGEFMADLSGTYDDDGWHMYDDDGQRARHRNR